MKKQFFVYIITNYTNTILYVGISNNVYVRTWRHKKHINSHSFSAKYRLYKVVWMQEFSNPNDAIVMEKKIKGWRREKKLNLIRNKCVF